MLAQNASLPVVTSPTWDDASLSLLSDIFAPQPPTGQQRRSVSSLPKYPQTSEALPGMGGDQIISELLGNCHNKNSLWTNPPSSGALPSTGGVDIISDLLHVCSSQNPDVSLSKSPAVCMCPKTSVDSNIRRSTSTVSPPLLQQVSTPTTLDSSLSQQQRNQSLSSCGASFSLPDQSTSMGPQINNVRHLYQSAHSQSPLLNGVGLNCSTSLNGWENTLPGNSQTLPLSLNQSVHSQPQVEQLLSSQQVTATTTPPTLPKLTPLSNQLAPRPTSCQAGNVQQTPPIAPTTHCQLPVSDTLQHANQFSGCVSMATTGPQSADSAVLTQPLVIPSSAGDANQSSVNLLNSILNSLSESELESLLNTSDNPSSAQPLSQGNGRQGQLHSTNGLVPLQSQINLSQNFTTPKPTISTIPQLSHSSAAANLIPVPHPPRSNVTPQVSKGTHFRVESSCMSNTAARLSGHLYQLEPPATAAVCGGVAGAIGRMDSTNIMTHTASALRLHSGQ